MSNYNERLDEILMGVWHKGYNRCNQEKNHPDGYDNYAFAIEPKQAKQAITSLTKELVEEALKKIKKEVIGEVPSKTNTDNWKYDRRVAELKIWQHQAIDNKIKALEEV